jgi:spore maturation protein CgeB
LKIFVLGKQASITHWLEDAVAAFRAEGHEVAVGLTRRPWLNAAFEEALSVQIVRRIARRIERFAPDLMLAIGGFHVPDPILEAIANLAVRAPLVGWVGDLFDESAKGAADRYDRVAYTDSGLLARHIEFGFAASALFLPHAVDPRSIGAMSPPGLRRPLMVFVGNPTPHREAVVGAIASSIALYGPAWKGKTGGAHKIHDGRIAKRKTLGHYMTHVAALNIRNEHHVLAGLNQRNFDPCLAGAAVVTDHQPDLERCFEPGYEVLSWRTTDELNGLYDRILRNPGWAAAIGQSGRRRVLAEHTYAARLQTLRAAL